MQMMRRDQVKRLVSGGSIREAIREGIIVYGQEVLRGWTASIARTIPASGPDVSMGVSGLSRYIYNADELPKIEGGSEEQRKLILAALSDLIDRINKNEGKNPCAELFGGKEKALKALKKSTINIAPLPTPQNDKNQEVVDKACVY